MAGWGALGAALAGAATGVAQRNQNRQKRAEEQSQDAEYRREFDVDEDLRRQQLAAENAARAAAAGRTTADTSAANAQDAANKAFRSKLQLPAGWARMPDSDKISYLQKRQNAALQAGDSETATATQHEMDGIALGTQRESTATLNTQGRLPEAKAHVGLYEAQAAAARDLPARARQIAAGHDAASLARATVEANNRTELAHYQGNVRVGLAQLTAAYHLQGMNYEAATKTAIDQFNQDSQTYRQQTSARNALLDPSAAAGAVQPQLIMPSSPSITVNVPQGGGSLIGPNGELTPAAQTYLRSLLRGGGNASGGGGGGGAGAQPAQVTSEVQRAQAAIKNGADPVKVRALLRQRIGDAAYATNAASVGDTSAAAPVRRTLPPLPVPRQPAISGISPYLLPGQ